MPSHKNFRIKAINELHLLYNYSLKYLHTLSNNDLQMLDSKHKKEETLWAILPSYKKPITMQLIYKHGYSIMFLYDKSLSELFNILKANK